MSKLLSKLIALAAFIAASLSALATDGWRWSSGPVEKYRPEEHYMRGRGPKWRAKHAQISIRTGASR
jgi:hypothetical protein